MDKEGRANCVLSEKSLNPKKHVVFSQIVKLRIIVNFLMPRNIELLRYNVLYNICTYHIDIFDLLPPQEDMP